LVASANIFIISARMSWSEKTAEKRSFGLSCAKASDGSAAAPMASPVPARKRRRVACTVMVFLPVVTSRPVVPAGRPGGFVRAGGRPASS